MMPPGQSPLPQYGSDSTAHLPLTEGQIHDSAAEVVDAPLLVLRIAQNKGEMTRLVDWLRRQGLKSEGQISQNMLKRALRDIGVRSPELLEQFNELYATLDPEASGTISFSELHGELRRVKKLLTSSAGYGQGGAGGSGFGGMQASGSGSSVYGQSVGKRRGGSAARGRVPSAFSHEDGVPLSASELEQKAAHYRRQGELGQALRHLEAALAMHVRVHGERSDIASECSRQVADVCNSLGMQVRGLASPTPIMTTASHPSLVVCVAMPPSRPPMADAAA